MGDTFHLLYDFKALLTKYEKMRPERPLVEL